MLSFKGFLLLNSNQLRETLELEKSQVTVHLTGTFFSQRGKIDSFWPELHQIIFSALSRTSPDSTWKCRKVERLQREKGRKKANHPWSVSAYCYWVHIEKLSIINTCLHKHRKLRQCWLSCCWKNTFIYLCIAMFQHENHTHMYADHFHNPPVEVTVLLLHFLWPYGQEGCRTYRSSGHSVERFGSKDGSDTVWSTHWI